MADITYVLNDPSTPSLMVPVNLPPKPGVLDFKVDGYRGATPTMYTLEHQAACAHYTLTTSINYLNQFAATPVTRWATAQSLYVQPRAGRQMNAYYDRQALRFFYAPDPVTKNLVYTANSRDVVAHELGHAILDAMRPDLFNVQAMEVWAFHEAFGDIHSILNMLTHEVVIDFVLNETGGDLRKSNIVSELAEEMGHTIYNMTGGRMGHSSEALRNAVNTFEYTEPERLARHGRDNQLTSEPHSFSRVFTGAWYDILVRIYEDLKKTIAPREALMQARDIMARYTFQAIPISAATIRFFNSVARSMLVIDKANGYKYNQLMNDVFIARKILRMAVRPMVSMHWSMFAASEVTPSDEVLESPNVVAVRSKSITNMPLPYYMLNAEVPNDTYYEFDDTGNCVDCITVSGEELVEHAHACVEFLYEKGMIRHDHHTPFEIDADGNLIRSHFSCACAGNNSQIKGQPEYGKGYKPQNNAGCGCNSVKKSTCNGSVTLKPVKSGCVSSVASGGSSTLKVSTSRAVRLTVGGGSSGGGSSGGGSSGGGSSGGGSSGGGSSSSGGCANSCEQIGPYTYAQRTKLVIGNKGVDGGDVSADNPLPVTQVRGVCQIIYDEVTLVPSLIETTVVTYTVPTGEHFGLTGFIGSANIHGIYKLYVDGQLKVTARSTVANPNVETSFGNMNIHIEEGETVALKFTHEATGLFADVEASLLGYEW